MQHRVTETVTTDGRGLAGDVPGPLSRPLRIYTLGRFSLVRDGTPLRYTRKVPSKPLLLLKALIASGGRQVSTVNIAASLWPDRDGDLTQQSFDTTLHRLRKFLGADDCLLLEDARLTLNSEQVWVDAWEFERHLSELNRLLNAPGNGHCTRISHLADRVLGMYQGHFLARDETACWMVSMQERLRNKYVHYLIDVGNYWESRGLLEQAIYCYQKGIEVDDLIETFYQRLMQCYLQTGRGPEAIATYRQCRQVLSVVLGLQPDGHTTQIYHSVLEHCARRA